MPRESYARGNKFIVGIIRDIIERKQTEELFEKPTSGEPFELRQCSYNRLGSLLRNNEVQSCL
jgi:hypothetical protein